MDAWTTRKHAYWHPTGSEAYKEDSGESCSTLLLLNQINMPYMYQVSLPSTSILVRLLLPTRGSGGHRGRLWGAFVQRGLGSAEGVEGVDDVDDGYHHPRWVHTDEVEPEVHRVAVLTVDEAVAELSHEENDGTCIHHEDNECSI